MMLKVKKLDEKAFLPTRGKIDDAGLDLYALHNQTLRGGVNKIKTGIAIEIPDGHVGLILDRSSVPSRLHLDTVGGVIDSNYRGEVVICFRADSNIMSYTSTMFGYPHHDIKAGERVAQLVIVPYAKLTPEWSDELSETERGSKGFGSSGR